MCILCLLLVNRTLFRVYLILVLIFDISSDGYNLHYVKLWLCVVGKGGG